MVGFNRFSWILVPCWGGNHLNASWIAETVRPKESRARRRKKVDKDKCETLKCAVSDWKKQNKNMQD